ncbi:MAG: Hsp20/alpha crystallin family protein [Thermoguttaceae bacterium]|jgi:HSP20 family protein
MTKTRNGSSGGKRGKSPHADAPAADVNFNLGGLLGKFGGVVEKLVDLAERGEQFARSGEISGLDPKGKLRGVYGVSIRTGLGDHGQREVTVEPFGNVRQQPSGQTVFEDVREPLVDVHPEEDHVLVLAEIPGVSKKDVQLHLDGTQLTIEAQRGEKRYRKEVVLPVACAAENMRWECINGILRIRLGK